MNKEELAALLKTPIEALFKNDKLTFNASEIEFIRSRLLWESSSREGVSESDELLVAVERFCVATETVGLFGAPLKDTDENKKYFETIFTKTQHALAQAQEALNAAAPDNKELLLLTIQYAKNCIHKQAISWGPTSPLTKWWDLSELKRLVGT